MCSDKRQEFILFSDTLGVSMVVDLINHRKPDGATESTVFGPFHRLGAPELKAGGDIAHRDKAGTPTSKPMLAVTRLPPGPVCHVAYIDGQANRNANELARQAADEFARDFKCGKDEVKVIGERGTAVNLAKR